MVLIGQEDNNCNMKSENQLKLSDKYREGKRYNICLQYQKAKLKQQVPHICTFTLLFGKLHFVKFHHWVILERLFVYSEMRRPTPLVCLNKNQSQHAS